MFDDCDMTDNLKTGNNNVSTKNGGVETTHCIDQLLEVKVRTSNII